MGFGLEILPWPFSLPDEGVAGATHRRHLLTRQLRRTGSRGDWRRTAEELDETPQVLRGCSEQHLILYSAQAAQPGSRSSFKMRFMWVNRISIFLRSRRDCWNASVLARARTRSRTSSSMSRVTFRLVLGVHCALSSHRRRSQTCLPDRVTGVLVTDEDRNA